MNNELALKWLNWLFYKLPADNSRIVVRDIHFFRTYNIGGT